VGGIREDVAYGVAIEVTRKGDTMDNSEYEQELRSFALRVFEFNSTLAARIALGHGIDRETVGAILHSLADAIITEDCAENMSPVSDGNTLAELDL
jgi:hypothetical protein